MDSGNIGFERDGACLFRQVLGLAPVEINSHDLKKELHKAYAYYAYGEEGKIVLSNTMFGDKCVYSTVEDMEKFNTALLGGYLLSDQYVITPVKLNSGEVNSSNYGYGFWTSKSESRSTFIMHTGGIAYFATINMVVEDKYQINLLQNSPKNPYKLSYDCYHILEGKKLAKVKPSTKDRKIKGIFEEKYKIDYGE